MNNIRPDDVCLTDEKSIRTHALANVILVNIHTSLLVNIRA